MIRYLVALMIFITAQVSAFVPGVIADSIGITLPGRISYVSHLQEMLGIQVYLDARSGEPTVGGPEWLNAFLKSYPDVDCMIITLGVNDLACNLDPSITRHNLFKMLEICKAHGMHCYIGKVCFLVYDNTTHWPISKRGGKNGRQFSQYVQDLYAIYADLEVAGAILFPFLSEDVIVNHTNDFVHPTTEGGKIIAASLIDQLLQHNFK